MISNTDPKQILHILLVEDDTVACTEMANCIDECDNISLVATTNNASDALNLVNYHLPDAVILDLELHHGGGNGLEFLNNLRNLNLSYQPYILVTTNNCSEITYQTARQLGADFIMSKHESTYSAPYVIHFLQMISQTILSNSKVKTTLSHNQNSPDITRKKLTQLIYRELDFVGISRKNNGYQYLCDAILLTFENRCVNPITALAMKYNKSDNGIEHSMQYAINRAWRTHPIDELAEHYTAKTHSSRGVPTVSEFIFYYTDLLKLK